MRLLTVFHRFLTTLNGFIFLLGLFFVIGIGFSTSSLQQMNHEARYFVNTTMLNLFVQWNEDKFATFTSDEMRERMTEDQLIRLNMVFNHLGHLLNYHGARGGLYRSSASWWLMVARYRVRASFKGGQFVAVITLIKQDGRWTIGRFDYQYAFFSNQAHPGSLKMA